MKKTIFSCLLALLAWPFLAASQTASTDDMTLAVLDEKMENLGQEMEKLGEVMESYGQEMERYGKELESSEGQSTSAQKKMEELGDKMNALGEEMGKLGEVMGKYGEKMGETHQSMTNWFFQELKKDGLISSLNGKARVIFDEKGLNVDGENAPGTLFKKYKSGLEKYWGKPLKPDFTFFFKGTLNEKDGKVETNGSMNTDF
ncbi:MAG: hypothetical protein IPM82_08345 [Saprospiraceae bacterium]|nr:hypothetical protein [Saprospiraceae bacterium]